MNRSLRTPRWWGIHLFTVLAVPFCVLMGLWQLERFSARTEADRAYQEARTDRTAVPLTELLPVSTDTVGRRATVSGRYDPEAEFQVPDRRVDGQNAFYVLTLFRTDGGRALPVVRGWLPAGTPSASIPPPPRGRTTVTGALQASENQRTRGTRAGGLPEGRIGVISAATFVSLMPDEPRPPHDAWITVQEPAGPLRAVPPVVPEGAGLDLKAFQNLGYTGEWFVFAGFVVFMWFRLRRRELEQSPEARTPGPVPAPPSPTRTPAPTPSPTPSPSPSLSLPLPPDPVPVTLSRPVAGSGPGEDARKDRILTVVGGVLAAVFVGFLAWSGTAYLTGQNYSGELVTFDVVSPEAVDARLSVRKNTDAVIVCTLRALSEQGREVSRVDVRFPDREKDVDRRVRVRTTDRATALELVGCQDAKAG
ncbi:SURF1 family cytochrome oxidase biogenesis protein [Streptomyces griseus]|uniref:SURF1 family cytochrome oxidase biogenesis protein n=1 Tax=Streptomyces griseus TaxID=1911 RepID=UPI00363F2A80